LLSVPLDKRLGGLRLDLNSVKENKTKQTNKQKQFLGLTALTLVIISTKKLGLYFSEVPKESSFLFRPVIPPLV
jgi:hypothetical protein